MPPKRAAAAAAAEKNAAASKAPSKVTKAAAKATNATASKAPAKKAPAKKATPGAEDKKPARRPGRPRKTETDTKTETRATTAKPKAAAKPAKANEAKKPAGRPAKRKQEEEPSINEPEPATNGVKKTTKRKGSEDDPARPAKKAKVEPRPKSKVVVNQPPAPQRLHVYVCGSGDSGELGLGRAKTAINVKRPRLNPPLAADTVGVVQVAAGGMHALALTHDNKILSWGVNDQGALGRDTAWEAPTKEMDADESDSDSDSGTDAGLNPREATPTAIPQDKFPEGTIFTQLAAGDSCSFALTDEGLVYGWGTFRGTEGVFGFSVDTRGKVNVVQREPMLLPGLKKIVQISCGANHVIARDVNGTAYAWGSGQHHQLGRRITKRNEAEGLNPAPFRGKLKNKLKYVACGADHSFAIDRDDNVWTWGLNNYGETGITDNAGTDDAWVGIPTKVQSLAGRKMKLLRGGGHHSVGVTEEGDCLVWGRLDGYQMGIKLSDLPLDDPEVVRRQNFNVPDAPLGAPRILLVPTKVPNLNVIEAACGSDHTIAITKNGEAYSWGFNVNYQTGQGETDGDIEVATRIANTAVKDKKLNWAGAGGQYSILTSVADEVMVNGTDH